MEYIPRYGLLQHGPSISWIKLGYEGKLMTIIVYVE